MVKTTITTTIDSEIKEVAMPIIQFKLKKSLSEVLQEKLEEIIKENGTRAKQL